MELITPQDVRFKAQIVLSSLTELQNAPPLNDSLKELIDTYDSPSFRHYRESFFKLTGLSKGRNAGYTESSTFLSNNIFYDTAVRIGYAMDSLRKTHSEMQNNPNLTQDQKKDLIFIVGLSVYTGLEAMAAHEEALNHAFQH